MRRKVLLFAVGLLVTINSFAQLSSSLDPGQEYTNKINHIFQHVNKGLISTGLLSDYGLQIVEPEYFDGIPADSNYVDMDTWRMLYTGMYSSKVNNNANLVLPSTVFDQIDNIDHKNAVPLAVMNFKYERFREDAVSSGALTITREQIFESSRRGTPSPYEFKYLFAVAPKKLYFDEPSVSFVFIQNLWHSNVDKTVQKCEINFNNQSGYILASWNIPTGYTFDSEGMKTIYFRVTYTDGTSFTSQTNILVRNLNAPPMLHDGNHALKSTTNALQSSSLALDLIHNMEETGQHSGGTIQVKYSTSNNSGKIRKPLIVAEGFDLSNVISSIPNVDIRRFIGHIGSITYSTNKNLLNDIDLAEYDIVYLDYNDGVDDIWRNAQLFREVIEWVNREKEDSTIENNVVMGISMGGLVARIALRKMELDGINHRTWKYISVDSPHKGANVPLGVQSILSHIQNLRLKMAFSTVFNYELFDRSGQIREIVDLLNSPAVKQMLIYRIDKNYNFDNRVHNAFQAQYDQLGFPLRCQNIAISNGSNTGALIFPAGSQIFGTRISYSLKLLEDIIGSLFSPIFIYTNYPQLVINVIPGKSQIRADINIKALRNQTAAEIYNTRIYIYKKLLWVISVNIPIDSKKINSTSAMLPLDGAPGGIYDINKISGDLPFDANDMKQKRFCFIPTVSSLALQNWEANLMQPVPAFPSPSFFDTYLQSENEDHTNLSSSALFLYQHLTGTNPVISGASSIYTSQQSVYTIENLPVNATVTWSCSNNLSIVSAQGGRIVVFAHNGHSATITATFRGGGVLRKTIGIITPIFNVTLHDGYATATFLAHHESCIDWQIAGFTSEVGTGIIECSSESTINLYPMADNCHGGYVTARSCIRGTDICSEWHDVIIPAWRPKIDKVNSALSPACTDGSYYITLEEPCPYSASGINTYYWFFNDYIFDVTNQPHVTLYAGTVHGKAHKISVIADIPAYHGVLSLRGEADFYGSNKLCPQTWSAAYPNPVGNELIINKEGNDNILATKAISNVRNNSSEITVLLYSNATTRLVYTKTYPVSTEQIKIDTSKLPNGIYYLNIISNGEKIKEQTIVVKH